jgi:hypothetical protein
VHILLSLSIWRGALQKSNNVEEKMHTQCFEKEREKNKRWVTCISALVAHASHLNASGASQERERERECETADSSFAVNVRRNVKHILLRCGELLMANLIP